jgi:hypothetical protein
MRILCSTICARAESYAEIVANERLAGWRDRAGTGRNDSGMENIEIKAPYT